MDNEKDSGFSLDIKPLKTAKSKIPQRVLMKKNIIPRHPSSVIFNGSSGSGKSTLLLNLLTRKEFYKDYFDHIFLISPTGGSDDLFGHLKIPPDHIDVSLDISFLEKILEKQKNIIEKKGIDGAPRILVIFEDVQGNAKYMKESAFLKCYIANRHYGLSVYLCGQSYTRTPRACRLQANNVFYFKGSGSELEKISEEYCPPGVKKKEFAKMVDQATSEPFSFMHINMREPFKTRYRKNLGTIMTVGKDGMVK